MARFQWNPGAHEALEVKLNDTAIRDAAEDIRKAIKSVAPIGKGRPGGGPGSIPGWLKASIYADKAKDGKSWVVFSADVFSFLAEYGSKNNRPYRLFWVGIAKAGYTTSSGHKVSGRPGGGTKTGRMF